MHKPWTTYCILAVSLSLSGAAAMEQAVVQVRVENWPQVRAAWMTGPWGQAWRALGELGMLRQCDVPARVRLWESLFEPADEVSHWQVHVQANGRTPTWQLAGQIAYRQRSEQALNRVMLLPDARLLRTLTGEMVQVGSWALRHEGGDVLIGTGQARQLRGINQAEAGTIAWNLPGYGLQGRFDVRQGDLIEAQWRQRLPVQTVDRRILRVLPSDTFALASIGLGGQRLPAWLRKHHILRRQLRLAGTPLKQLAPLLEHGQGTALLAFSPGILGPTFTAVWPRSATADRFVRRLAGHRAPYVQQANLQAVAVPSAASAEVFFIRRDQRHWYLSTRRPVVDALVSGSPGTPPALCQELLREDHLPDAALLIDTKPAIRYLRNYISDWSETLPQLPKSIDLSWSQLLRTLSRSMQRIDVRVYQKEHGSRIAAKGLTVPMLFGLVWWTERHLPVDGMGQQLGQNLQELLVDLLEDQRWDSDAPLRWPERTKVDQNQASWRLAETGERAWLYLPSDQGEESASLPVLVEHPNLSDGLGSKVVFQDGMISFCQGATLWDHARRLSVSSRKRQILPMDWAAVHWQLNRARRTPHRYPAVDRLIMDSEHGDDWSERNADR